MKTLLLVDGTGYLYRAYHALPDLRTSGGLPTGAVRGFVTMLRTLRAAVPCEHAACVFDAHGPTFRDELYPEYKAHRPPTPPDLVAQGPLVREAARALGWTVLEVSGVEADDVIATLAADARAQGAEVVIASGDKDLAQMVDEGTVLIDTMSRDGGPPRRSGCAEVKERFGVPPDRIVDYLALVGDTADNVPGVPKVGPKTAARWIEQYGSLDAIMARAGEIPGVVGENLRATLGWLPTGRVLVTVRRDVEAAREQARAHGLRLLAPDRARLADLYTRCEFRSWLRDLDEADRARADRVLLEGGQEAPERAPAPPPVIRYECITRQGQLEEWLARLRAAPLTALDTETTGLDPLKASLVGISLCTEAGLACYIPLAHDYPGAPEQLPAARVLDALRPWLQDADRPKVLQNAKYDRHILANAGIELAGVRHDTLLASYVVEAHRSHDLSSLAQRHLGRSGISYEEVCGKGARQIPFSQVDLERATAYSAEDADLTLGVHAALWPRLEAEAGLRAIYEQIELPLSGVLLRMERNGVLVDVPRLQAQSADLARRMLTLEAEAHALAGGPFNLASPKQIGELLFSRLGLPVLKKTATGVPSTDEDVLERLALDYPLPRVLLEYRSLAKLRSTYCDKLPAAVNAATGRVHTTYGQATAVTGRLASTEPNLQNIPVRTAEGRRIREAFIAPPGSRIVSADYSQIELRILAVLSGDEGLRGAFSRGEDVHRATAAEVFGVALEAVSPEQRRAAKAVNFGLIYGMSAFGLAGNLGISRDAAQNTMDRYFDRYPRVARYMDEVRASAHERGFVETAFGRRLWLPDINGGNGPRRQAAERAAINAPMQGTAADLIKRAMIAVDAWLQAQALGTRLVMQVHDELVLEVPEAELTAVREKVPALMAAAADWAVPLEVSLGVGANWDEAH
jgi:DNA polymerase-1